MLRTWISLAVVVSISASTTAQVRPFGNGCDGHLPSSPALTASTTMVEGVNFDLRIDAVAKSAPFMLVFGASNQTWAGSTLPLDLTNFGFPGCFLNIAYDKVFGLTSDAAGKLVLPIPGAGLMGGQRLYAQIVVPEPNGARLAASPGFELSIQKSVKPFSVYVLPDTQSYVLSAGNTAHFVAQTDWIVSNHAARNGVFVSHVGDIVLVGGSGPQNNKLQWDRAASAITKLDGDLKTKPDGVIPYSTAVGNRDFDIVDDKRNALQFDSYFGPSRYTGRSWFRGHAPNRRSTYQVFAANGTQYLHIALEWRAADDVLAWAQNVLVAHPDLPAMITTHQFLGSGSSVGIDDTGAKLDSSGDNGGAGIREKLVEPFPQIFVVVCGHNISAGQRQHTTVLGQTVHQMLMDYSFDPNGGNGWMHDLVCRPNKAELQSICMSPTYQPGVSPGPDRGKQPNSSYTLPFDFHAHRRTVETTRVVHFTGGYDHGNGKYTGALDTFVASATSTSAYGSNLDVEVIDPAGNDEQQGLIKFGGLFGTAAGQVPKSKRIVRAILTLTTEGAGSTSTTSSGIYRLLVPFDENSTWSSLTNGITVGTDTEPTPVVSTGSRVASKGTRSFDVTASVRAWHAGGSNHGWAIINQGLDSWSFRSQEWGAAAERPMLTVVYER